jgi:hypothetical protein
MVDEKPVSRKPRSKKLSSRMNIWIRRIHLFSGLFMLPWVLLYGVTALLFNHPNVLVGPDTEVVHFRLEEPVANKLPSAESLAGHGNVVGNRDALAPRERLVQSQGPTPRTNNNPHASL